MRSFLLNFLQSESRRRVLCCHHGPESCRELHLFPRLDSLHSGRSSVVAPRQGGVPETQRRSECSWVHFCLQMITKLGVTSLPKGKLMFLQHPQCLGCPQHARDCREHGPVSGLWSGVSLLVLLNFPPLSILSRDCRAHGPVSGLWSTASLFFSTSHPCLPLQE